MIQSEKESAQQMEGENGARAAREYTSIKKYSFGLPWKLYFEANKQPIAAKKFSDQFETSDG